MATNGTTNGHHATNGSGHGPIVASGDEFLSHDYDFVIAGGGTAALTIAARLTENPDIKVGVIEAGKHRKDDPLVDTPAAFTQMLGNAEYDWIFKTVPQVKTTAPKECTAAYWYIRRGTRMSNITWSGVRCWEAPAASTT